MKWLDFLLLLPLAGWLVFALLRIRKACGCGSCRGDCSKCGNCKEKR